MDIVEKRIKLNMNEPITVVVTGAAGQIAYSLYAFLGTGSVFGISQPINLRLLDIEPAATILQGVELELQDCAYPLFASIKAGCDPNIIFQDADVCIFLGGFPRKPGMERKDLLAINNKIFKEQGQALDKVGKKTCKSVVIANPANTNCLTLALNCPSIPKKNFTCLTRLDHNRAKAQLALKTNTNIDEVKNVIIWGNHSLTQYPDYHHATINGQTVEQLIPDTNYLQNDFIKRVQKRGGEILETRKNSSVLSAASATRDHLKSWFLGTPENEWVSMGVYVESQNPYNIQEGLVFSFPVTCKNFEWQIVPNLTFNTYSLEKIQITQKELIDEKNDAQI